MSRGDPHYAPVRRIMQRKLLFFIVKNNGNCFHSERYVEGVRTIPGSIPHRQSRPRPEASKRVWREELIAVRCCASHGGGASWDRADDVGIEDACTSSTRPSASSRPARSFGGTSGRVAASTLRTTQRADFNAASSSVESPCVRRCRMSSKMLAPKRFLNTRSCRRSSARCKAATASSATSSPLRKRVPRTVDSRPSTRAR